MSSTYRMATTRVAYWVALVVTAGRELPPRATRGDGVLPSKTVWIREGSHVVSHASVRRAWATRI